jgi:hypothetical protein
VIREYRQMTRQKAAQKRKHRERGPGRNFEQFSSTGMKVNSTGTA